MADGTWSLADAKAKFSEVVEKAKTEGPQRVTRNGRDAVVVVSADEWRKRTLPGLSMVEVLLDPSVRGILEPGEERLFDRDRARDRSPVEF
jgi:antitoxin Phd